MPIWKRLWSFSHSLCRRIRTWFLSSNCKVISVLLVSIHFYWKNSKIHNVSSHLQDPAKDFLNSSHAFFIGILPLYFIFHVKIIEPFLTLRSWENNFGVVLLISTSLKKSQNKKRICFISGLYNRLLVYIGS